MIQKGNCAIDRMAKLPIVRSAWSRLSHVYTDTKSSHPNFKVICDALEDRAVIWRNMASNTVSPVMMKLEPQISIANYIACKSLDWLESTFSLLQAPREEVVAIAIVKMYEAQEVVGVAATSALGCAQHSVKHALDKVNTDYHSNPVIERAMTVAQTGLGQALSLSEMLLDHMLPPAEEEEEKDNSVQGFESTTLQTYPVRLQSINTKLCRRTYKAIEKQSRSPCLVQRLQTHLTTFICSLPLYLQHQAVIVILFISQMYTLSCQSLPQQIGTEGTATPEAGTRKDLLQVQWQESPTWRLKQPKAMDCRCTSCDTCNDGCNAKVCTSP